MDRASILQRLMWALLVVPLAPIPNNPTRLLKCLERVLPDTLLFQAPKQSFDHLVLLQRVGRDELLLQSIVATGLPEPPTLEDQAIVTTENGCPDRTERPEPLETGDFHHPFRPLGSTPEGEFVADEFAVMSINHGLQMRPAIMPT